MQKCLLILAVSAIMAVSVSGQPDKGSDNKQSVSQYDNEHPITADATNKDNYGKTDQPKPSSNTPSGNAPVERPHWWAIPDWWLVIVATLTGGVICWQSVVTRRTAQSAERQIALQSIAMRQWVNIEPVKVSVPPTFKNPLEITLQFEVRNRTDYLITIKKIVAHAALGVGPTRTFTVSHSVPVPPEKSSTDGGHPFYVGVFVDRSPWTEHGAIFVVTGEVTYMDCMDIQRTQSFEDLFQGYSDGRLLKMKPSGIAPEVTDYEAEGENQT